MKVTRIHFLLAKLFTLLVYASARNVQYGQRCRTPYDETGNCLRIGYCPQFEHLLDSPITESNYNILKENWCGNWRNYPLICCRSETPTTTTTSSTVRYGERCHTPERRRGTCITVRRCPEFAHLIGEHEISESTLTILSESYCGTIDDVPLICCPSTSTTTSTTSSAPTTVTYKGVCWTPNALKGECIKERDCPQFAGVLEKERISESYQAALNESFCGMRRKHRLVCCPIEDKAMSTTSPIPEIETIKLGHVCRTHDGEIGTCINDIDCSHAEKMLLEQPQSTKLTESLCEMKDGKRLVCCPLDTTVSEIKCKTPSGDDGKCIAIIECSVLSTLIDSKNLTRSVLELLQKSHCESQEKDNLYCCPLSTTENDESGDLRLHKNLYLLDQNICGKSSISKALVDNIDIGKKAQLSSLPWMALIAYDSGTTTEFKCVGSIINRRYIVTAARCVTNLNNDIKPISVRLGEHNLEYALDCTENSCAPAPQNIYIQEITAHPNFLGNPNFQNDIALIRLTKDINFFTGAVQPICLPIEESLWIKDYTNKNFLVSGWFTSTDGLSPVLLQDVVHGESQEACLAAYENVTTISLDSQICVHNGRDDDCLGKGASPLVSYEKFLDRNAIVLQGIGLFGPTGCYHNTQPVVYLRVANYVKWILDHLKA